MKISKNLNHDPWFKLKILGVLIALLYLFLSWYPYIGRFSASLTTPHDLKTVVDDWIPLVPQIIKIYLALMFFPIAGLIFAFYKKLTALEVAALYIAHILLLFSCYAIYLIFPTSAESVMVKISEWDVANNPALEAIDWLYRSSVPYNSFPSYHVAPMVFLLIFLFKKWRTLFWISLPLCVLISAGAVLTKFHFFVDVLGGIAMGIFAYYILYEKIALKYLNDFVRVEKE